MFSPAYSSTFLFVIPGLLSSLCQQVTLALTHQKWIGLLAVAMGSLGSVAFPAISAIKSNNAQEHEQGAVQVGVRMCTW